MEEYATHVHETNDIFLEFRISKPTQEKGDELSKALRSQRAQMRDRVPPSQWVWTRDDNREEEND